MLMEQLAASPPHAGGSLWPAADAGSGASASELFPDTRDDLALHWPAPDEGGDASALGSAPAPAPAAPLRCLDTTHAAACSSCTPAPDVASDAVEAALYTLHGATALHWLRSALLQTREWNSTDERELLAAACEATGDTLGLAPMLRRKKSSAMRKVHLMALCHLWGYRCDVWRRKGDGCRKRHRPSDAPPAAPAAGALTLAPPRPVAAAPAPTDDAGLRLLVAEQLGALLTSCVRAHAGTAARAAMDETGVAAFTSNCLDEYEGIVRMMRAQARGWRVALAQQRAWSVAAASAVASPAARERGSAAWSLMPFLGMESPAECGLTIMQHALVAAHRVWAAYSVHEGATLALHSPTHPLPVALREYETAVLDGLRFVTQATLLLARLRAEAPLRAYAVAAQLLVEECVRYCDSAAAAFVQRAAWTSAAMARGVPCQAELARACSSIPHFDRITSEAEHLAGADADTHAAADA